MLVVGVALIVAFNRLYTSMRMMEQNRQFNVTKSNARQSRSSQQSERRRRRPHDDRAACRVRNRQAVHRQSQRRERREGPPEAPLLHEGPKR